VVTIRRANEADAASLAALAEHTVRDTFSGENSHQNMEIHCARSYSAEIQLRELSGPLRITMLAEVDGSLAGFAQLLLRSTTHSLSSDSPCELNRLYVLRKWHGRGVARELMSAVLCMAAQGRCEHVWLGVWERNEKAIAFYRTFGFAVIGGHDFALGTDTQRDLVMAVQISAPSTAARGLAGVSCFLL